MNTDALTPTWNVVGWIVVDAVLVLAATILVVRVIGLRSFAKMSSFDFAVTVACGSVVASILLDPAKSFVHGALALFALLAAQWVVAKLRIASEGFRNAVDNEPLLIMRDGEVLEANLRSGRLTHADLRAKLREANVTDVSKTLAVVLETTGDISVLHGDEPLDEALLQGVRA